MRSENGLKIGAGLFRKQSRIQRKEEFMAS